MRKEKWIWLDMDGTIADLYNVSGWLDDLENFRTRPYENARIMYDVVDLLEVLTELKFSGWNIGIISWLSKAHNRDFDKAVTRAKEKWLVENCLDLVLDEIIITPYGQNKSKTCEKFGYGCLVDDEKPNRDSWENGFTINANENIIEKLANLLLTE